jgi:hypothetical protein
MVPGQPQLPQQVAYAKGNASRIVTENDDQRRARKRPDLEMEPFRGISAWRQSERDAERNRIA